LDSEVDVADVPHSGVADKCALAGYRVDGVNRVAVPRRREQDAIGRAHAKTIVILIYGHGTDAVRIDRRNGVQRCEINAVIVCGLIKRPIRCKSDSSAVTCTGVAYQGRSGRDEVDGVQHASLA
jgi:hypothetical protein